jgi:hypothetical protein
VIPLCAIPLCMWCGASDPHGLRARRTANCGNTAQTRARTAADAPCSIGGADGRRTGRNVLPGPLCRGMGCGAPPTAPPSLAPI